MRTLQDASTPNAAELRADSAIIEDRKSGLFRVHRSVMVSDAILRLERERIFSSCWLYVGHESEVPLPGDYRRRNVGGRDVFFVRGTDGQIRVFLNSCPHRGATICRQDGGNAKHFPCFYHSWVFDSKGALVGVPDEEGYSARFDCTERSLVPPARTQGYRGFLFISFDPDIIDLTTYLAGAKFYLDLIVDQAKDGMRVVRGSNSYSIRANWKLLIENSLDVYHGKPTHATFFQYMADIGGNVTPLVDEAFTEGTLDLGNGHAVVRSYSASARPIAHWSPIFGEKSRDEIAAIRRDLVEQFGEARAFLMANTGRNLLIFPNLIIVDTFGITVRTIQPISPDQMEVAAWELAPAEESGERLSRRLSNYLTFFGPGGFATPDDAEVLESCQAGFTTAAELPWSDISRGMARQPGSSDELQMRIFWRAWQAKMTRGDLGAPITTVEAPGLASLRKLRAIDGEE